MNADPSARILALLDAPTGGEPVGYRLIEHAPAYDAEQAARLRDTPLGMGAKSLVMKMDRGIGLAVLALPADRQVDNALLRKHLGIRRYRFATPDELFALTGLDPGAVPPFGRPVFDAPLYVDEALAAGPQVAFTAASHTLSVVLATRDWLALAAPADRFPFSRSR